MGDGYGLARALYALGIGVAAAGLFYLAAWLIKTFVPEREDDDDPPAH